MSRHEMHIEETAPNPQGLLEIALDAEVSVQLRGGNRIPTRLLGKLAAQYLVLRGNRGSLDGIKLDYGESVIVRYLHEGVVYAFRSFVLHMALKPEKLIFLAYPQAGLQRHSLRQAQRLACTLPCRINLDEEPRLGLLVDLSATGCQVVLPNEEGHDAAQHAERVLLQEVDLQVADVDGEGAVNVAGTIRRSEADERRLRIGIEFSRPQVDFFQRIAHLLRLNDA